MSRRLCHWYCQGIRMVAGISSCLALHKQTIPHIPSLFGGSSPSISLDYSVSLYCSSLIGSEEVITLSFVQVFSLIDGSMAFFLILFFFCLLPTFYNQAEHQGFFLLNSMYTTVKHACRRNEMEERDFLKKIRFF